MAGKKNLKKFKLLEFWKNGRLYTNGNYRKWYMYKKLRRGNKDYQIQQQE